MKIGKLTIAMISVGLLLIAVSLIASAAVSRPEIMGAVYIAAGIAIVVQLITAIGGMCIARITGRIVREVPKKTAAMLIIAGAAIIMATFVISAVLLI